MPKKRLGELLMEAGLIDGCQLRAALAQHRKLAKRLGLVLVRLGMVSDNDMLKVLSEQLKMPVVDLVGRELDPAALALLDEEFCREHECLPFAYQERGRFLNLAMAQPNDLGLFEQVRLKTRCNPRPFLAGPLALYKALKRAYPGAGSATGTPSADRPAHGAEPLVIDLEQGEQGIVSKESPPGKPRDSHIEIDLDFGEVSSRLSQEHMKRDSLSGARGEMRVSFDTSTQEPSAREAQPVVSPSTLPVATQVDQMCLEMEEMRRQITDLRIAMEKSNKVIDQLVRQLGQPAEQTGRPEPSEPPSQEKERFAFGILAPPEAGQAPAVHTGERPRVAMDFGTTRSSVAVVVEGQVVVLTLPSGERDMPSVVGVRPDGSVVLGQAARSMLGTDPVNAIASPKRLLGRKFDDPQLKPYLDRMAMFSTRAADGEILLEARDEYLTVEQICSNILRLLAAVAQRFLRQQIEEVVLTIPVEFDESSCLALTNAATIAGLRVANLVEEPVAAALPNCAEADLDGYVGVYDFGGGTFDFSIIKLSGVNLEVVATAGDTWLGGDDFDDALANAAANAFWNQHQIELRHQVVQWQRLLVAAEQAKRQLSASEHAVIKLPEAALTSEGAIDLAFPVDRALLGDLTRDIIVRSFIACEQALAEGGLRPSDLMTVYLSSGTSYIPAVQQAVANYFGKPPAACVPPERAVIIGAAMHSALSLPGNREFADVP